MERRLFLKGILASPLAPLAVAIPQREAPTDMFRLKGLNPDSMFNRDSIMALVEALNSTPSGQ